MAEKAYGGIIPCEPMENACEIRKRGEVMARVLVNSALRPVNMKLDSNTSFCTSLAILSTVPGLVRPRASLRSENEVYASLRAATTELSVRNEGGARLAISTDYEDYRSVWRQHERTRGRWREESERLFRTEGKENKQEEKETSPQQ